MVINLACSWYVYAGDRLQNILIICTDFIARIIPDTQAAVFFQHHGIHHRLKAVMQTCTDTPAVPCTIENIGMCRLIQRPVTQVTKQINTHQLLYILMLLCTDAFDCCFIKRIDTMCMHGTAQPVQRMTFIGFPWFDMRKEQEIRTIAADIEYLRMTLYHGTDIVLGHALQHFFRKNLMCNNIWHRTLLVLASCIYILYYSTARLS